MLAQTPGIGHGARRQGVADGAVVEFFGNWVVGMQAGDVVPEFGGQAGGRSGVVRGDGHQVQGKRIVGGAVERAEIVPGVLIRRATVGGDFPAHRFREQAKVFRARKELRNQPILWADMQRFGGRKKGGIARVAAQFL